ncbi:Ig-like domain-containing protein [Collimonas sp.]|jgi:hypothetical protein|uniref:Ig-like domain-containing protein n=1 Tax=Collimonas sp. TaxID=1963772 RepID=UPI002BC5813C|nr:Ig-like domain-containing protein [Collimonas sp.]HWX01534.1 Ig-like domain-containing protein [Collimonas sp.]
MAASAVKVLVVDGKEITQSVDLRTTKQGSATKVKAIKGGKFILADTDTGAAPENITAHRVGNNLHVSLQGTGYDDPELIIEDFYSQDGQGELVGVAEDGAYYQYIASDAEAAHEAGTLGDNVASPLVLGSQQLVGFGAGLVPAAGLSWLGLGLFGLGALGLIGAALADNGGNSSIGGGNPGGGNPGDGGGGNPGDGGGNPGNPGEGDNGGIKPNTPNIGEIDDNVQPHTGPIPDGGVTNDNHPVLIGTGDPGDIVTIIDNGKPLGTATVDDTGKWTFKPETPLDEGEHEIVVIGTDPDGQESDPSPPKTIIVDTTPPAAPVIDGADDNVGVTGPIGNGGTTDDAQPVLHGTAEANSVVAIYDGATLLGSAQVDGDGNWSFQPPTPLFIGEHHFTAIATDAAGNSSVPSNEFDLSLLVGGAPSAPAITGVIDHVEPNVGPIQENGLTNDAEPTIQGTAKAGSIVIVYDTDGTVIGSATSDATGHWEVTPTTPLADGLHNITATATEGGVVSAPTAVYPINVDTSIPAAPVIDDSSLIDHVGAITGPIMDGGTTDDSEPEFKGTALPNAIVTIYDGDQIIGSTTSDADGNWDFYPSTPLSDGPHVFSATATNAAGGTSVPSAPINFIVDTSGVVIAITGVIDNEGPITGPISRDDGVTDDPRPQIVGTATANSLVMVYDNDELIGSTTSNAQGRWTLTPEADLPEGANAITATSTNPATGVVSDPTAPFNFTIDTHIPAAPVIEGADDNVGAITGPIGNNGHTDDSTPTLHGTAEANSIVTIYDGALVLGSVQAGADGSWSFTPTTPLTDGPHDFTATSTDAAGKTGPVSNDWTVNIDTGIPLAPTIGEIDDNVEPHTGPIPDGGVTNDNQPVLVGTGTPGDVVTIIDNGTPLGTATVGDDGNWTFKPDMPLDDGDHDFTVIETNPVGSVSDPSPPKTIVVDTTAPVAPVIDGADDNFGAITGPIGNNGHTDDTTPTLHGTAEANSIVTIYDGALVLGSVQAGADGGWRFTPTTPLANGAHDFTAIATDAAGNPSAVSNDWAVNIDTSIPMAPTISEIDDNVEPHTGPIPEGEVTNDNRPVLVGTGTAGDIVTIRDNGTVLGTATVGAAGTWTFRPTAPLADGDHVFTAIETNPVGTVSAPSLPHAIVVDTTAPPAPVITVVDDSAGAPIGTGDDTTELRPVVHGTAEPNSIVTIYDGTTLLGSAPVDGNGNWVFPTTADLALGLHNLTAVATDPAGNPGGASNPYGFDIVAPAVPWISTPTEQFSGEPLGTVIGAAPYVTSNSGLTISGDATIISQTGSTNPGFFKLGLNGTTSFTLAAGYAGNTLSFSVINPLWAAHGTTIALYNAAGDLIGRATIPAGTGQNIQHLNFQAPPGQLIASFVIENPTPTFAIDSIFTSTDWDLAANWGDAFPTPVQTTIEVGAGVTAFEAPVEPDADDQAAQAAGVDEQLNTDQADADKADADKAGDDALQASASDEVAGIQSPEASSFVLQEDVQMHVEQAGETSVLVLESANQVLDLSALTEAEQAQVGDAKIIDITGTGDNTLNLSLADVLEQGGKSLFIDDGKTQMMVKGDAGDVVNLDDLLEGVNAEGDWTQAADAVTVEGVAYNVYQHSNLDAELLVQQGVTTNLS